MTTSEFFGCALLAFGPALAMFVLTIAQDSISIIIVFASAFYWMLSLLLTAIVWLILGLIPISLEVKTGLSVLFSVLCQELFRYLIYKTLRFAEGWLKKVMEPGSQITNRHVLAYASGLGFGIMSGIFSLVNVLADAVGPATMGLKSGSDKFFLVSASLTFCFVLLHVFWSVIFFSAMDRWDKAQIGWVVVSHLLASSSTLANPGGYYISSIIPNYIIVFLTACSAFYAAGGTTSSLKACFSRH